MVQINSTNREITITMPGDTGDMEAMQQGLITMMQRYNTEDFPADESFYYTLQLLAALLPSSKQLQRGITSKADYMELPEALTPKQRKNLHEALMMVKSPGLKIRSEVNPVLKAFQLITD